MSFSNQGFREEQKKFPRVRQAYKDKGDSVEKILSDNSIQKQNLRIYLRAFKSNKIIELWGRNSYDDNYVLLKEYSICKTSGRLGPKRRQGDRQIPEGFYHIDKFNPYSNFYLSLGIDYPNKSDIILGDKDKLGGDIYIHGSCVTIGCLPITDEWIKELYIFCVESKNSGQTNIPITIFPVRLSNGNLTKLLEKYEEDSDKTDLWKELKLVYDYFNDEKQIPEITFMNNGRHKIN